MCHPPWEPVPAPQLAPGLGPTVFRFDCKEAGAPLVILEQPLAAPCVFAPAVNLTGRWLFIPFGRLPTWGRCTAATMYDRAAQAGCLAVVIGSFAEPPGRAVYSHRWRWGARNGAAAHGSPWTVPPQCDATDAPAQCTAAAANAAMPPAVIIGNAAATRLLQRHAAGDDVHVVLTGPEVNPWKELYDSWEWIIFLRVVPSLWHCWHVCQCWKVLRRAMAAAPRGSCRWLRMPVLGWMGLLELIPAVLLAAGSALGTTGDSDVLPVEVQLLLFQRLPGTALASSLLVARIWHGWSTWTTPGLDPGEQATTGQCAAAVALLLLFDVVLAAAASAQPVDLDLMTALVGGATVVCQLLCAAYNLRSGLGLLCSRPVRENWGVRGHWGGDAAVRVAANFLGTAAFLLLSVTAFLSFGAIGGTVTPRVFCAILCALTYGRLGMTMQHLGVFIVPERCCRCCCMHADAQELARHVHIAVLDDNPQDIRDLALVGVQLDEPYFGNMAGSTALMTAAINGHVRTIRALVECGASLEASDPRGGTALLFAAGARTAPAARRAAASSDP